MLRGEKRLVPAGRCRHDSSWSRAASEDATSGASLSPARGQRAHPDLEVDDDQVVEAHAFAEKARRVHDLREIFLIKGKALK